MGWRIRLAKKSYRKAKEKYGEVKEHHVTQAFIGKPPQSYRPTRRIDDDFAEAICFGGLMKKRRGKR